jgi:hypothetical protein
MRRQRPFVRFLVCDVVSRLNHLPDFIKFRVSLKKSAILVKIGAIPVDFAYSHKNVPGVSELRENRRKELCEPLAGLKYPRTVTPCDTRK